MLTPYLCAPVNENVFEFVSQLYRSILKLLNYRRCASGLPILKNSILLIAAL